MPTKNNTPTKPLPTPTADEWFGPVIHSYSRRQAIEDGVLVDVTLAKDDSGAKLSPFKWPVAMTRAAYAVTVEAGGHYVPDPHAEPGDEMLVLPGCQSVPGRLWDVFWMLLCAVRSGGGGRTTHFRLLVNDGKRTREVRLKSICGPGDDAAPVITILLPDED